MQPAWYLEHSVKETLLVFMRWSHSHSHRALALGGGGQFEAFGGGLKAMHELLGSHIVDLRSQVCVYVCARACVFLGGT